VSTPVWKGGVGLFMVSGAALLALALAWLRGFQLRSRFRKYNTVFEFTQACGICVGTPVRIRGVTVGSVVRVDSSLRSIDALVEVPPFPNNSFIHQSTTSIHMLPPACQMPMPMPMLIDNLPRARLKMIKSSYHGIQWLR